jgi:hypothetical protein
MQINGRSSENASSYDDVSKNKECSIGEFSTSDILFA